MQDDEESYGASSKGVRIGTLYKLDACTVQCNSSFDTQKKKSSNSSSSPLDQVEKEHVAATSNGCAFWIPKGAQSLEMKLLAEKPMLWYQRIGHIGEKGLGALKNKSLVKSLDDCNLEFDFCEYCV